jgi:hypothetical protein
LDLLTGRALMRASPALPMFRELVDQWGQLDMVSRRRNPTDRSS